MQKRKQENDRNEVQLNAQVYVICRVCGRKIKPETCSWQEDDEGAIYCADCRAESESCGCSD